MRKLCSLFLCLALLSGCFAIASAALTAENFIPSRVVSTFYADGTQGFHWYTKEPSDSDVRIFGNGFTPHDKQPSIRTGSKRFQGGYAHEAVASNLTPGTYTYQVGCEAMDVWSEPGTFTVNPGPGNTFAFAVIADAQSGSQAEFEAAAQVLESAFAKQRNTAFVVNLGDFTNHCNNAQWDQYFRAFGALHLKTTLAPVAGNHDGNLKWNWFRNMFTLKEPDNPFSNLTGVYYSFDYGDAHFAVLNTNDMYPMSMQQRNWLVNDMRRSAAKWKLLLLHRGLFTAGRHANEPDILLMRRQLAPLVQSLGIDLVLAGHDHTYYRSEPVNGTVHIVANTAGPKKYSVNANAIPPVLEVAAKAAQPNLPIFSTVAVDGGTLTYRAYTYDMGAVMLYDTLTLTKTNFTRPEPNLKPLSTDFFLTLPQQLWSAAKGIAEVLFVDYISTLLPKALGIK
jgi:predicted phosphodiesterase